jgi:ketosteroid isomerase-like protein
MIGLWIHRRIARTSLAKFGHHELDAFMKAWDEDGVFVYPGTTSMAGRFEGKQTVRAWFQRFMDRFPRIEFTVKHVGVEKAFGLTSNVTSVEWRVSVTNTRKEDYAWDGMTVISVDKGKAVLVTDYIFDTSVLKRALGEDPERLERCA